MEPNRDGAKRVIVQTARAYLIVHVFLSGCLLWAMHEKRYDWAEPLAFWLIGIGPYALVLGYYEAKYTFKGDDPQMALFPASVVFVIVVAIWFFYG